METPDYCREIEAYLCQKNGGHLIRVVGPSFDLVSRWAAEGVPLKIALRGIDRYCERYYRKGPRRRPVRIDFCEADVLDAFDEWRRALGLTATGPRNDAAPAAEITREGRGASLPAHLERALTRLTQARVTGALGPEADPLVDHVSRELDAARASARGIRGDARRALVERLAALDAELVAMARAALSDSERRAVERQAEEDLAGFRDAMAPDAYRRARDRTIDQLARERLKLPTLGFV